MHCSSQEDYNLYKRLTSKMEHKNMPSDFTTKEMLVRLMDDFREQAKKIDNIEKNINEAIVNNQVLNQQIKQVLSQQNSTRTDVNELQKFKTQVYAYASAISATISAVMAAIIKFFT